MPTQYVPSFSRWYLQHKRESLRYEAIRARERALRCDVLRDELKEKLAQMHLEPARWEPAQRDLLLGIAVVVLWGTVLLAAAGAIGYAVWWVL